MKIRYVLIFMLLNYAGAAQPGIIEELHLVAHPADSFELSIHTGFYQDINTTYPPHLSGYALSQQNDTLALRLYYLIPAVIGQSFGATVINTIKLGTFNASGGVNYLTIYPSSVDSSLPDTTACIPPDTTLLFPWMTGVDAATTMEPLNLYPNPVRDVLTINPPAEKRNVSCILRSVAGVTMYRGVFTNNNPIQIPVTGLRPAIYTVGVASEGIRQIKKLIVQ